MDIADFFHFTRGGKIRYHWFLLPLGEWVAFDMRVGLSRDNVEQRWDGDGGQGFYWYRKSFGDKMRKAIGVYASNNKLTSSVEFRKPYEEIRVWLDSRD